MNRIFTTFLILFISLITYAEQYNLTGQRLSSHEGLPSNTINSLLQDKEGYIWIATDEGINCYDGYQFVPLALPKAYSPIIEMKEDKDNNLLWLFGKDGSTHCIDLTTKELADHTKGDEAQPIYQNHHIGKNYLWLYDKNRSRRIRFANGKFSIEEYEYTIHEIATDDAGNDWILTDRGLYLNGFERKLPESGNIFHISTYRNICLALTDRGIVIYNQSRRITRQSPYPVGFNTSTISDKAVWHETLLIFTQGKTYAYQIIDGVFSNPTDWQVEEGQVVAKQNQNIYVSNKKGKLTRFGKDNRVKHLNLIPEEQSYTGRPLFHIAPVNASTEAIATYGNGLYLYNIKEEKLTHYTKNDEKSVVNSNYLTHLMTDRSGCLWLAEEALGLNCLRFKRQPCQYRMLETNATIQNTNNVTAIAQGKNNTLWLGNILGEIYCRNMETGKNSLVKKTGTAIQTMFVDSQNLLWAGTNQGLWIEEQMFHVGNAGLTASSIRDIATTGKGDLWIATEKGIFHTKESLKERTFRLCIDSIGEVYDLATDSEGKLWAATKKGIKVYTTNTAPATITPKHLYDLLSDTPIIALERDINGTVWAATAEKEIWKCTPKGEKFECSQLTLPCKQIYALALDQEKNVWVATEAGILRIAYQKAHIQNFRFTENPLNNLYNTRACITWIDGRLLFGTYEGFAEINVNDVTSEESLSPTLITFFSINDTKRMASKKTLKLGYNQRELEIHYSNMQHANLDAVRYQYKLVEKNEEWSPASTAASVHYHELSPGKYTFLVRSDNGRNHWSEPTACEIIVHDPWWNTWPAYLFYLLILGSAGFYLFSLLQQEKSNTPYPTLQEKEKETISKTTKEGNSSPDIATEEKEKETGGPLSHPQDEHFIMQLKEILNKNRENPTFSVEDLATQMGMGRTKLYEKCKETVQCSPASLLKKTRLEYAASLLLQTSLTIDEIRIRCGYGNSTNFYNQFKQHFGTSPLQYKRNKK